MNSNHNLSRAIILIAALVVAIITGTTQVGCSDPQIQTDGVDSSTAARTDSAAAATSASSVPDSASGAEVAPAQIRLQRIDGMYAADVAYTYTNRSGDSIFLVNCNGDVSPSLERLDGDTWTFVWQPMTNACLSPPVAIADGASYSDTLKMVVQSDDAAFFGFLDSMDKPTRFRLVFHQALTSFDGNARPFGPDLAHKYRVFNEFMLSR